MDDRQGAIPLGVHLRQSARLVAGWHQEQVTARHEKMLDFRVEAHIAADLALEGALRPPERVGVLLLALAHHDDLAATRHAIAGILHQPTNDLHHHIDALLPCQTPDETDEDRAGILVQSKLLLHRRLVCCLTRLEIIRRVLDGYILVGLGIPHVVDAVEDAAESQCITLCAHVVLQAEAALRCLDLLGVVRRDCENSVCVD
mmetsp:Transcript_73448/g.212728  ORF Transcript_73448/g.212728 Transcript_73448/m.212728 type:complete len:202 (+) Transcript_73448:620-1225(+)